MELEKSRKTWKNNLKKEHPEIVSTLFAQRYDSAFDSIALANKKENSGDYSTIRQYYSAAVESIKQCNALADNKMFEVQELFERQYLEYIINKDGDYKKCIGYVKSLLAEKPDILQTEIYGMVPMDKADISLFLYFAAKNNEINREKSGRTYKLTLSEK